MGISQSVSNSGGGGGGAGTVTSVALALPNIFTISGSPVTGAGTLTGAFVNQVANKFFAGPTFGADAAPTFRAIALGDLPSQVVTSIQSIDETITIVGTSNIDLSITNPVSRHLDFSSGIGVVDGAPTTTVNTIYSLDSVLYWDGDPLTSSQWITSGSNIYFDDGVVSIGDDDTFGPSKLNVIQSTAQTDINDGGTFVLSPSATQTLLQQISADSSSVFGLTGTLIDLKVTNGVSAFSTGYIGALYVNDVNSGGGLGFFTKPGDSNPGGNLVPAIGIDALQNVIIGNGAPSSKLEVRSSQNSDSIKMVAPLDAGLNLISGSSAPVPAQGSSYIAWWNKGTDDGLPQWTLYNNQILGSTNYLDLIVNDSVTVSVRFFQNSDVQFYKNIITPAINAAGENVAFGAAEGFFLVDFAQDIRMRDTSVIWFGGNGDGDADTGLQLISTGEIQCTNDFRVVNQLTVEGDTILDNSFQIPSPFTGSVTLVGGTATVVNAALGTNNVVLTVPIGNSIVGQVTATITPGVGFTIDSTNVLDTRVVKYLIWASV